MYCISCTLIIMYKYIGNYVNTSPCHTIPISAPPPPLPLYSSDLVGTVICKAQNFYRKCCIHTVCYFSNWYYILLPYYNSIVTESCPGTYLGSCWDEVLARYLDLVGVVRTLLQIYNIEKG